MLFVVKKIEAPFSNCWKFKCVVDFRSDWALCCCRFAFAQKKHLLLPLRFRTEKTFVAAASLSHRKNICCCRFAFAQKKHLLLPLRFHTEKTFVAAASLSHRKNICCCRFAFAQSKASWGCPMSRFWCCCRYAFAQKTSASLRGLGPTRCWSRRHYHRM